MKLLLCVVLLAVSGADLLAQSYPRVILVQIRSEHNRLAALTRKRAHKAIEELTKDALGARSAMIYDFNHNFHYCPVYYFIDTNMELVKRKQFNNILLDNNGIPVTDHQLNSNSEDYAVVYYGYYIQQSNATKVVKDSSKYIYDAESTRGKGLVVLNDDFQQISYVYKLGWSDFLLAKKKVRKDFYSSKNYDIDYYPLAQLLEDKLLLQEKKGKIPKGQY